MVKDCFWNLGGTKLGVTTRNRDVWRSRWIDALLKLGYMENIVNGSLRWQFKLVCNWANSVQYLKRPKKFGRQLMVEPLSHFMLFVGLQLKEDIITRLEAPVTSIAVSKLLHSILSSFEVKFQELGHGFMFLQTPIHFMHLRLLWQIGKMNRRRLAIKHFIWAAVYRSMKVGAMLLFS